MAVAWRSRPPDRNDGSFDVIEAALLGPEDAGRAADRAYWTPREAELKRRRHG